MIEIIYDKSKEKEDEKAINENAAATPDEAPTSSETTDSVKLPKNIRQVGNPSGNKRIYIEDYVITYLSYISRPGSTHARGAILLGEIKHSQVGDIVFISGAVDAQNIEFDMDESKFDQEVWSGIYADIKENFPDLSVVGWFLSRMGFSTAVNEKIEKLHVENFSGKNKVLYVTDSLEEEDAFYMYERGQLVKQRGYYIYYARNEAMQSYIIKKKGGICEETNTEIHRKDEELIKQYREKNSHGREPRASSGISLMYVASSFVVLIMLAMGITVISNYDKMKEMEVSINRLELTAEANQDTAPVIATEQKNTTEDEAATGTNPDEQQGGQADTNTGAENPTVAENTTSEDISTEQTLPVMTNGNPTYYTVKAGDTLSSIAYETYGSIIYAEDIAEANKIDIEDNIYEGDEILLPAIDVR